MTSDAMMRRLALTRAPLILAAGLAALVAPVGSSAQTPDLSRCLAIADINQRVQCYDALPAARLRGLPLLRVSR